MDAFGIGIIAPYIAFITNPSKVFENSIFKKINRVALHAHELEFIHPVKGKIMCFEAPLPEDFKAVLEIMELENGSK